MKVENMTNSKGNKVANQFIIFLDNDEGDCFQSYNSVIVKRYYDAKGLPMVELDRDKWDYSTTTCKYRNIFLGETKKETEKKIKNGTYILTDLNK